MGTGTYFRTFGINDISVTVPSDKSKDLRLDI
jgi:hypothetical protein